MSSSSGTSSACAWASAESASEAPVTVAADGGRDQQTGERLVAVQADERALAVAEHGEQLVVAETVEGGHGGEVGVDALDEVDGQVRQGAAQAADAPRGTEATGRRPRIEPAQQPAPRGASTPSTREVGGGHAVDGDHERAAAEARGRRRAGQRERLAQPVAQRLEPEVLLERRQRVGERLGHGAGPEHRAGRRRQVVIGRACSRCSSPASSTAHSTSCGPP